MTRTSRRGPVAAAGFVGTVAVHAAMLLLLGSGVGEPARAGAEALVDTGAAAADARAYDPAPLLVHLAASPSFGPAGPLRRAARTAPSNTRASMGRATPRPAMAAERAGGVAAPASATPSAVEPERDAPYFREPWEVDEVATFLHPPARLAEILETSELPLHARISVYLDARGSIVRTALEGSVDEDLATALQEAFHEASFLPARHAGVAVPSVKRFEVGSALLSRPVLVRAADASDERSRDGTGATTVPTVP